MHAKWCISDIKLLIVYECVSLYVEAAAAASLMNAHIIEREEKTMKKNANTLWWNINGSIQALAKKKATNAKLLNETQVWIFLTTT